MSKKEYKTKHDWLGKIYPQGIVQEIKICPDLLIVRAQTWVRPRECNA